MKFGYQGYWWKDDRQMFVNSQSLQYTFNNGVPNLITQYLNGYKVNARAMSTSLYAQDQWTLGRLTVQGALRYDNPWSWFPEADEPASRFFAGASFPKADGVTGYHDITPRMGAAYDLFGNGKTSLKVNLGKYLQGASVSNLAYGANPALRIPGGDTTFGGTFAPSTARSWTDNDRDFVPDCDLNNPLAQGPTTTGSVDTCAQISNLAFGGTQTRRRQFRSRAAVWVGRASVGLVVRRVGAAGDRSARIRGSRLLPALVHAVFHRRHGDRQPGDLAERRRRVHDHGAERCASAR